MSEKALVDHIFVRLEPQVQDYEEVRNPQNTVQLLEVLAKFEERYSHDLIMNIPHTSIMSALDLRSEYFQLAVNPSDIVKTAFVTKNGTYAFRRVLFGLSGAAPNSQREGNRHHTKTSDREACECVYG
ncbi:hypothetical protein TNCV_738951 [Trichonephila clavipes]|nr:hypothetical protein TNCV_738951 [Trichonephila clavipes]